jgi:hypothetical protein
MSLNFNVVASSGGRKGSRASFFVGQLKVHGPVVCQKMISTTLLGQTGRTRRGPTPAVGPTPPLRALHARNRGARIWVARCPVPTAAEPDRRWAGRVDPESVTQPGRADIIVAMPTAPNPRSSKGIRRLRPRRSRRISLQTPSQPPPKSWRRWLVKVGAASAALVGFVAAILGIVAYLLPRMVADAPGLFDDANSYSISFKVTNTGWIPLRNVRLSVGICSMKMDRSSSNVTLGPQHVGNECGVPGFRIGDPWRWESDELLPDKTFTINLSDPLSTPSDKIESDDELIKRALSDAPDVVARSATVISMGANGEIRTLREGTGQWTCTPGLRPNPPYRASICSQDKGRIERMAALVDLWRHPTFSFRTLPKLEGGDVVLIVSYRPWFLPWGLEEPFRFIAEMQPNGKIMWRQRPMH